MAFTPVLVEDILEEYRNDLNQIKPNISVTSQRIWDYVSSNLHDPELTVSSLAEHLRIHSSGRQKFHYETGVSIKTFILKHRIESAKQVITQSKASLFQVCFSVGFNQYESFRKAFHRLEGISPSKVYTAIFIVFSLFLSGQ